MNEGKNYSNEIMNVASNLFDQPFESVINAIDELCDCEISRVNYLEKQKTYLLLVGAAVLAVSVTIICIYFLVSDKYFDIIWEHLRLRCLDKGVAVRKKIRLRISAYHEKDPELFKKNDKELGKDSKKLKYMHSFMFMIKFSPLFLVSLLFILLTTLYFYSNLKGYLYYKPLLISSIPRRSVQIVNLSYLVLESYAGENNYSIYQYSPDFIVFASGKEFFNDLLNQMKTTGQNLNNEKTKILMSDELYNRIYYKITGTSPFLSVGTHRARSFLLYEIYYIIYNEHVETFQTINDFLVKVYELDDAYRISATMSKRDSKNIIEKQLNYMIVFVSIFSLILLVFYVIVYKYALCYKIKILSSVAYIIKLIPRGY